jgi:hypothetical protein
MKVPIPQSCTGGPLTPQGFSQVRSKAKREGAYENNHGER